MQQNIDVMILFASMLAENKKAHKGIDKIYNSKKDLLLSVIQENKEWRDLFLVREGSINRELYLLKIMAILTVEDEEVKSALIELTEKTYKSSYNFLMSKKKLVLDDYAKNILKKDIGIDNSVLEERLLSIVVMANWYGIEVDLDDDVYNLFIKSLIDKLEHYHNPFSFRVANLDREDRKLVKQISSNLRTNYLKNYLAPVHIVSSEKVEEGYYIDEKLDDVDKFLLPLLHIYDNEDVTLEKIIEGVKITDRDIDDIVATYLLINKIFSPVKVNYKELYKYACVAINEISLIRAYKKARDLFMKNLDLDSYDTLKDKIKENEELKNKVQKLQEENEKLKNELALLEKKNNNLSNEINKFSSDKKELAELREYIFNLSEDEEVLDDKDLFKLKDLNAVCFGGQPKWIARMKEIVNWRFISPDALNFDVDLIKNSDYVFINTSFISHGMYYRIIENLTENNKLKYINNTNVQRCLEELVK